MISEAGANLRKALFRAKSEAFNSSAQFRHGAVLFRRGRIVSVGYNQYRTVCWAWPHSRYHESLSQPDLSGIRLNNMHAEISAMHNVPKSDLAGKDIFVVRINKAGTLMNSQPCRA